MKNSVLFTFSLLLFTSVFGDMLKIDVTAQGVAKQTVTIDVGNAAYAKCLKKNLELSGLFEVKPNGSIKVTGVSGAIKASGAGKALNATTVFTDEKSARMAARKFSDAMCENYGNQKGFACNEIAFVNRKGSNNSALCAAYPDGYDIRCLSEDGAAVVGPRWKDENTLFYTNLKNGPQIWEQDVDTGRRRLRWSFKGVTTGATVSPDGKSAAVVLSFQGSPKLYVIDMASGKWRCLTPNAKGAPGEPAWSPDGKSIVYVSNDTRHPQLYIVDVETRKVRRLTSKGTQNVNPDWGRDGRIVYITKRGQGAQIAVLEPSESDANAMLIGNAGNWEHPSWAADARHVVAESSGRLFVVDTLPDGDKPRQMFEAKGTWINPSWRR